MGLRIVIRGGGDLASGVVLRLVRAGWQVFVLEIDRPLAVRRSVSFAQAVYDGQIVVEGVVGRMVTRPGDEEKITKAGMPAVMVDPNLETLPRLHPDVLVDARMLKQKVQFSPSLTQLDIGLGPGFETGVNCHAVIETRRGPNLGRVYWHGGADLDTGIPDAVGVYKDERVLRAPIAGKIQVLAKIGDILAAGSPVAAIDDRMVTAPFPGVLRGVIHNGLVVTAGIKIGDLDPRSDPNLCFRVSDKALAVGGGVLEAILTKAELRGRMWL
jgi:xanthine dehydrogenase accessory factor